MGCDLFTQDRIDDLFGYGIFVQDFARLFMDDNEFHPVDQQGVVAGAHRQLKRLRRCRSVCQPVH